MQLGMRMEEAYCDGGGGGGGGHIHHICSCRQTQTNFPCSWEVCNHLTFHWVSGLLRHDHFSESDAM